MRRLGLSGGSIGCCTSSCLSSWSFPGAEGEEARSSGVPGTESIEWRELVSEERVECAKKSPVDKLVVGSDACRFPIVAMTDGTARKCAEGLGLGGISAVAIRSSKTLSDMGPRENRFSSASSVGVTIGDLKNPKLSVDFWRESARILPLRIEDPPLSIEDAILGGPPFLTFAQYSISSDGDISTEKLSASSTVDLIEKNPGRGLRGGVVDLILEFVDKGRGLFQASRSSTGIGALANGLFGGSISGDPKIP